MQADLLIILLISCTLIIIKDIILGFLLLFNFRYQQGDKPGISSVSELPFASILIAARNEEANIERCIKSIKSQNYPVNKFEILVGNDRSNDTTLSILRSLEKSIPNLIVVDIKELKHQQHGKMNVLAQLGEIAKGNVLLFTDADTVLPNNWITLMVDQLKKGYGFVTGTTLIKSDSVIGKLQSIEWMHAIGMMKVLSDLRINVSTLGNNMGISKEAYRSVGGFMQIPFSITEDHEIFHQVCRKGYSSFHIFEKPLVAYSSPLRSFWDLLIQRKRWMKGAFSLPIPMLAILILNSLFVPLLIILSIHYITLGLAIFLLKVIIQSLFIGTLHKKLNERLRPDLILIYEFYFALINLSALIVYMIPIRIVWKGRRY